MFKQVLEGHSAQTQRPKNRDGKKGKEENVRKTVTTTDSLIETYTKIEQQRQQSRLQTKGKRDNNK
jgi:hypothetical protein